MRKIIFLLLSTLLFANPTQSEKKIFQTILKALFPQKSVIKIYTNHPNVDLLHSPSKDIYISSKEDADILILEFDEPLHTDKPVFVRKYQLLKKYKNQAIGGFYWQKGRPNIIFLKNNLKKYNFTLPESFNTYIEDQL